jgi:predicted transcriptional regulator
MTDVTELELAVLKLLAGEWDKSGPPGFLETTAIAKALEISIADAKKAIHSLFVKGLVGTNEIDIYAAYLFPEGYEIAQGK